jgi:predicted transcriptional regulator
MPPMSKFGKRIRSSKEQAKMWINLKNGKKPRMSAADALAQLQMAGWNIPPTPKNKLVVKSNTKKPAEVIALMNMTQKERIKLADELRKSEGSDSFATRIEQARIRYPRKSNELNKQIASNLEPLLGKKYVEKPVETRKTNSGDFQIRTAEGKWIKAKGAEVAKNARFVVRATDKRTKRNRQRIGLAKEGMYLVQNPVTKKDVVLSEKQIGQYLIKETPKRIRVVGKRSGISNYDLLPAGRSEILKALNRKDFGSIRQMEKPTGQVYSLLNKELNFLESKGVVKLIRDGKNVKITKGKNYNDALYINRVSSDIVRSLESLYGRRVGARHFALASSRNRIIETVARSPENLSVSELNKRTRGHYAGTYKEITLLAKNDVINTKKKGKEVIVNTGKNFGKALDLKRRMDKVLLETRKLYGD